MKIFLFLGFFTIHFLSLAQVGIGTSNPVNSSMLDINAIDKGVLIPRVSITSLNNQQPITGTMAAGLLVYNTNATLGTGFYYWDGSIWVRLQTVTNNQNDWELNGNTGTTPGTGTNQNFIGTRDNRDFVIATNRNEAVRIKNNGNVGIGTTDALKKLHVNATIANDGLRLSNANINADVTLSTTNVDFNNSSTVGSFSYDFANTAKIIIQNSLLYPAVNSLDNINTTGYDMGRFNQHFRRVYTQGVHTNDDSVNGGLRIAIGSSGGSVPDYQFSDFAFFPVTTNVKDLGRTNNVWRNFYYQSAIQSSDKRLKQKIQALNPGLEAVMKLKTYSYAYNSDSEKIHFGFMAQEINDIVPELVSVGTDENRTMGVNYTELIPVLVNAIKEQQSLIAALESRLSVLEN